MAASGRDGDDSILHRIEEQGHAAPRIRLRGVQGEEQPRIAPGHSGRYVTMGEISRGAVGIVYQGRDFDIGRDVAMKVLREDHLAQPEWVRRFLEEAQICGQLQHPGIVPIYEMGTQRNGHPYFTMKLVRGQTLAAMLDERESVSDNRRGFIKIFEQVCQTMAYAHSRGVIHSDLKPANVMVGNFGEVQVIDWGFAKVVPQGGVADESRSRNRPTDSTMVVTVRTDKPGSGSDSGTLLATPAYMAPEQAMSQPDEVDERSDVFSLGSILCEILTGLPPYTGDQGDLIEVAAQAKLEPAYERLDECGADPALIELARGCLGPLRRNRPRNAGSVRKRLLEYLASVEERAHRLQLETIMAEDRAQQARAEASEKRRSRRQSLTIAALVLFIVLTGGGFYLWKAREADRRTRALTEAYRNTIQQAIRHRSEGKLAEALVAAQSATRFASPEQMAETEELVGALEREREAAATTETRKEVNQQILFELESNRADHTDEFDNVRTDAAFAESFRYCGLYTDSLALDEAAARFLKRGEAMAIELAGVLDFWASIRWEIALDSGEGDRAAFVRLLELARKVDPDPSRERLREIWLGRRKRFSGARIRGIAAEMSLEEQSVRTLDLLGIALLAANDREPGVPILARLQRLHPEDPWTNLRLADALGKLRPARTADALRYTRAALALRPDSSGLRDRLALRYVLHARSLARESRFVDAIAILDEMGEVRENVRAAAERLRGVCELIGSGEDNLERIVAGDLAPRTIAQAEAFATLCSSKGHHLSALRLYRAGLELDHPLRRSPRLRASAARESVLAGSGLGPEAKALTDGRRAELRRQGREEMIATLDAIARIRRGGPRGSLRSIAGVWFDDPRLAPVRNEDRIGTLPIEEQQLWRDFWRDLGRRVRRG